MYKPLFSLFIVLMILSSCKTNDYSIDKDDLNLRATFEETVGTTSFPELTEEQKTWLVALPAIIMEKNKSTLDTLNVETITDQSKEKWLNILKRDWSIGSRDELLSTISRMEYSGHNESYVNTLDMIDKYGNATREEIARLEPLSEKRLNYYSYIRNNMELYNEVDLIAWDLGRMTSLIRWGYQVGYLTEPESWNMLLYFGNKLQNYYNSWEDYGNAYKLGRIFWASGFKKADKYKAESESILTALLQEDGFWSGMKWQVKLPEANIKNLSSQELTDLQKRTEESDKLYNVSARKYQSLYIDLANHYLRNNNIEEALVNYQKGLRLNAKDWESQLRVAKIEIIQGKSSSAYNRLKHIESNCDDSILLSATENLLSTLPSVDEIIVPENYDKTLLIHPYGNIPDYIISSLKSRISEEFKINVISGNRELEINDEDYRSRQYMLDRYMERTVKNYYEQRNSEYKQVIQILEISSDFDELTLENKYDFVEYLYNQSEEGKQVWPDLLERMTPQFNATVLRDDLKQVYREDMGKENVVGVLGVTVQDIFAQDYNFLFGWSGPEAAVMSIHRFYERDTPMTTFIKRSVNQGLSSTGYIVGIPRCTVATCSRAYPHNLAEHDRKDDVLCHECRTSLFELYNEE